MTLLNMIFFAVMFRVLGRDAMPRWAACFLIAVYTLIIVKYNLLLFAAEMYIFVIVRLLSTAPLLDSYDHDKGAVLKGIKRNLWILPALPFTSWWFGLMLLQSLIYYGVGFVWKKYPYQTWIWLAEVLSGCLYGLCLI